MAERVTRAQIVSLFQLFCKTAGFSVAGKFNGRGYSPPGLALDYYAIGGGYQIVELDEDRSGEGTPFGSRRYKPREFAAVLRFGIDVADYDRRIRDRDGRTSRANPVPRLARRLRRR